jgi:amino acid permease
MRQRKRIWGFIGFTIFLFLFGISVFTLSVYFGEQTKDPDAYEFLGWFAMLGIMFLSFLLGCAAFGMWLSHRGQTTKLFDDSKL